MSLTETQFTADGLAMYNLPSCGYAVSASEHAHKAS